jgi:hypothetical protein
MTRLLMYLPVYLLLLAGLGGCKQSDGSTIYPVSGQVLVNGKPAAAALVTFHPIGVHTGAPRPTGRAAEDGTFTLTSNVGGDGAPAGEYRVTVVWTQAIASKAVVSDGDNVPVRSLLPAAYASPDSTPLKATVKSGTNEPIILEIKTTGR